MKLGDTIFNGNQFKNVILNSTSYKRLILGVNLVWSYFSIAIKTFKTRILADGGTYESESILEDRLQEITPNLFDSASLVITPNGVKTSKLYTIKPNDGTGDLGVVRATSATRVNEQGLIEIPRTNLLFPSEDFNNVNWNKSTVTVLSNATISPDGNLTSYKLIDNTATSVTHQIARNVAVTSGTYTMSIFAKKGEYNFIRFWEDVQTGKQAFFDLNNGVATNVNMSSVSIVNFGNGWYRCIATVNIPSAGNFGFRINLTPNGTTVVYNGTGTNGVFIWGAQLEVGNVATEYIPTTSVIRTRFAGITQDGGSASNIPRIDYTNGSCPSILVEPQRTNLALWSEKFDNASWIKSAGVVVTSNSEISPDGTLTADTISFDGSNRYVSQTNVLATGVVATGSIYIKGISGQTIQLAVGGVDVLFTLNGNWQRVNATRTSLNSTFNINTFGGATARIISVWGAQLEVGANATSYIPTTTSSVTRNADVISKNGISNLIGQTEGTVFLNCRLILVNLAHLNVLSITDGTTSNMVRILTIGSNRQLRILITANSTTLFSYVYPPNINVLTDIKIAFTYKNNDFVVYINGIQVFTQSSGLVNFTNLLSFISIGSDFGIEQNFIKNVCVFPTRLSNTELAQLTTL